MNQYIRFGFLGDVYELFTRFEGTEWGDQMRLLNQAFSMGQDYAGLDDDEMEALNNILLSHITAMYEFGDYEDHYLEHFRQAQKDYAQVYANWSSPAASHSDAEKALLEETANSLPDWMKTPGPETEAQIQAKEVARAKFRDEIDKLAKLTADPESRLDTETFTNGASIIAHLRRQFSPIE